MPVNFTIYLPLRNTAALTQLLTAQQTPGSASYRKFLTVAQFAAQFGPTPASMAAAEAAAQAAGLQVTSTSVRSFHVSGTVAQANQMLQIGLNVVTPSGGPPRLVSATKPTFPTALAQQGAMIASFSTVPPKQTNSALAIVPKPANGESPVGGYFYNDMKQAYNYPSTQALDGTGVKVAILMGDELFPQDVAAYFNSQNYTATSGKPVPTVATVCPPTTGCGTVGGPDAVEASLDVQQVLGGAPGATVTLVSIPSLASDYVQDGYEFIDDNPQMFDVVNSSFGLCELYYTAAYNVGEDFTSIIKLEDEAFERGNAEGITFVASSGDGGGVECTSTSYIVFGQNGTFVRGISSPASSAYVTAVGGGNLVTNYAPPSLDSSYVGENGYGDPLEPSDPYGIPGATATGGYWGADGGRGTIFPAPAYQSLVNTGSTFRTNPDIGMQVGGCPYGTIQPCGPDRSFVWTAYDYPQPTSNGFYGLIGTSVASPEFVGALALYMETQRHIDSTGAVSYKVGNINTFLYTQAAAQTNGGPQAYHRNIQGFDGVYAANYPTQNYNYIYGNGSPDVRVLFGLTQYPAAGVPQTPTNP